MPSDPKTAIDRLGQLVVGQTDRVSRTISADDVAAFARLSGDYNALHTSNEFAARTDFERRVVHGFLHASLLSTLIGMRLPGEGALYLGQTIDFAAPVFIGDTVEARATITAIDHDTRVVTLATEISNQHGEIVLRGTARAKVLRLAPAPPRTDRAPGMSTGGCLLEGRVALITGASRGIGRAIARLFASHGARVWATYHRSGEAARDLHQEIIDAGGACEIVGLDVTNHDDVARFMDRLGTAGPLDILINNAGPRIKAAPFEKTGWADMEQAFEAGVGSVFAVTQAALPHLRKSQGRIINVLSTASLQRTAYHWLPYVAAKGALHAMSKSLAQELGPAGIRVNMVSPSMVETDLVANTPDRIRQMMISRTPLRRLATVDDVAGAILLLASPYADFISGENLLVAGGDVMI